MDRPVLAGRITTLAVACAFTVLGATVVLVAHVPANASTRPVSPPPAMEEPVMLDAAASELAANAVSGGSVLPASAASVAAPTAPERSVLVSRVAH